MSQEIVAYDRMVMAIDNCVKATEADDIRKKAAALEHYARMSNNTEAEDKCRKVRIWASTRCGVLMRQQNKASVPKGSKRSGARGKVATTSPRDEVVGLNKNQRAQFQQLAQAPEKVREYLDAAVMPTIKGAINAVEPKKQQRPKPVPRPYTDEALFYAGRLRELADMSIDPKKIADGADSLMRGGMQVFILKIVPFLNQLEKLL